MAATLGATCPNCQKVFQVPAEFVGKIIRCKDCQTMFEVQGPTAAKPAAKPTTAKPAAAKPATPATAKPAAKPAAPAQPAAPAASAPIPFKAEDPPPAPPKKPYADDEDDEANPYGVTIDASEEIPRCPHCAKELDPPDTKICLNCGYDLLERRRHETKAVYEITSTDYIKHLAPGVLCVLVIIFLVTMATIISLNLRDWMDGSFLEKDEKDEATLKKKFYVPPFCFNIWIWVISLWIIYKCGAFAIKRLVYNWKPTEVTKKAPGT